MTYQEARNFFYLKPEDKVNNSTLEGLKDQALKRVERPLDNRDRFSAKLMIEACNILLNAKEEENNE